jgi:hypothetical protein
MSGERAYESDLKKRLKKRFPGIVIMKNDPQRQQGIPDILLLYNNKWAMLEVKMADDSKKQPNQEHWVKEFNVMSFASFINPDTEEEVLNALQSTFGPPREARVS